MGLKLVRNSTDLYTIDTFAAYTNAADAVGVGSVSSNYLDSPATTSSTTYKVQFKSMNGTNGVYINNLNQITFDTGGTYKIDFAKRSKIAAWN
jgi:hypothetical protein